MKLFLMYLLVGLAPGVMAWTSTTDEGAAKKCDVRVIRVAKNAETQEAVDPASAIPVSSPGNHANVEARVVVVGADGEPLAGDMTSTAWVLDEGDGKISIVAKAGDGGTDGDGNEPGGVRTIKVVAKAGDEEQAADQGWLGISIGGVPEALASQLDLKNRGILVLNVVTGSPADTSGVQANDIILSINGQDISGEVSGAVNAIKSHKPGELLNLVVLRSGQQQRMSVKLASRADLGERKIEWKFEGSPDTQVEEHVKTRGKFMMRDANGNWITKDLGDLNQLKNLPHDIQTFVPQSGSKSIQVFVENGKKNIKMRVENDGSTVAIDQADGGEITVHRTDANGNETVAKYGNEDALKAGDESAYELYKEAGDSVNINVDNGARMFVFGDHESDLSGAGGDEWRANLEKSLAEAKDAYQRTMEEFRKTMEQWNNGAAPDLKQLDQLKQMLDKSGSWPHAFAYQVGKPKQTFTTRADGSIEVRVRKGDSEHVQEFTNEADLARRRPDLKKKYDDVKAADQE